MYSLLGILFTFIWATGSIAIKFGLMSAPPITLATLRLLIAGMMLIIYIYGIRYRTYRMPMKSEWIHLIVLGILNTTLYIGGTFLALKQVSAGYFNLAVTANPFVVSLFSCLLLKQTIKKNVLVGMVIAALGLLTSTYPVFVHNSATSFGLIMLTIGMLSMAFGSVYFKRCNLRLPGIVINTWQILIGSLFLIPFSYFLEKNIDFKFDAYFYGSLLYLSLIISILGMILWFFLLKHNPVKANTWLFLSPVFGYMLAALFLDEKLTLYDLIGTLFIVLGLFVSGNITLFNKNTLNSFNIRPLNHRD
ncbi:DMT family transporter [Neobacillus sp. NPDC097160]|uniref:DMT family transporter n=1 Tax=Neobacillus sp. NPDC097160 TaxID=3364298 RepID=UPI00381D4EBC